MTVPSLILNYYGKLTIVKDGFPIVWYWKQVGLFLSWEKKDSISYVVDYLTSFSFEKLCVTQSMEKIFSETQWLL